MTYQYLEDSDLDPGSPGNTSLFSRLARNPDAIAKGEPGAPVVDVGWHPYDMVEVGDGNDGVIYDYAVDGGVSTIETPAFEDGYEYYLYLDELRFASGFGFAANLDAYRDNSSWVTLSNLDSGDSSMRFASGVIMTTLNPTQSRRDHGVIFPTGLIYDRWDKFTHSRVIPAGTIAVFGSDPARTINKLRIAGSTGGTSGKVYLYKRRHHG